MGKKLFFSAVHRARVLTLKEERYSERQYSTRIGCRKTPVHSALGDFTKIGIYENKKSTGCPLIMST